ncbi:hypothetical protein GGF46_002417 [Coemansia sp. RSA 552]|nr:hypothetical protein GGF46_002417 [Coemansia sp. RSA 552]
MAPVPEAALGGSSDSLSDTKIFVLLAAIVFVFLLALAVAMARVSRVRRRQHSEHVRQEIVSASAPPRTLNKTILDLLPVFEVTEKRQLRQLQAHSPGTVLAECFADDTQSAAPPSAAGVECGEGSTPRAIPQKAAVPTGGYGLDSGKSSLCSEPGPAVHAGASGGQSYGSHTSVLSSNQGAMELSRWQEASWPKKRGPPSQSSRSLRAVPFAVETPPPAACRYYGRSATHSATPPASMWHSSSGTRWGTPMASEWGQDMCVNVGAVVYRSQSTQSLSLTPERDGLGSPGQIRPPYPAWLAHQPQPEITRGASRRPSSLGDCELGLGSCPICLEEFETGEQLRELPCMHKYHVVCIDTWLVSRSTCCPYCKMDIRRWYYGPDAGDEGAQPGTSAEGAGGSPGAYMAEGMAVGALPETDPGGRRGRRLRRIRHVPNSSGQSHGGLARMWRVIRTAVEPR